MFSTVNATTSSLNKAVKYLQRRARKFPPRGHCLPSALRLRLRSIGLTRFHTPLTAVRSKPTVHSSIATNEAQEPQIPPNFGFRRTHWAWRHDQHRLRRGQAYGIISVNRWGYLGGLSPSILKNKKQHLRELALQSQRRRISDCGRLPSKCGSELRLGT